MIDGVGDLLGGAAEAAGEAVLDVVVKFVFGLIANAVTSITTSIVSAMNATTGVDFDGGFFPALTPIRRTVVHRFYDELPEKPLTFLQLVWAFEGCQTRRPRRAPRRRRA